MMRTLSSALQAHLAGEVTTLAMCWKITRTDSTVMGFTNHDQNIIFSGVTYIAATAFVPSTNKCNSNMAVDNLEVDGILSSGAITESDILAGRYDYAAIEVFLVNYNDLTQGKLSVRNGFLGQVTINKQQFTAEIRGVSQLLQETVGQVCSPSCNAALGDSRCTVNLSSFTFTASVTAVTSNQIFTASSLTQPAGYFTGGKLTWTSGQNSGTTMEIKEFTAGIISCVLPTPAQVQVGDSFTIVAGCDKSPLTCKSTFNNLVNFRGFPSVPGMNALLTTAGTIQ